MQREDIFGTVDIVSLFVVWGAVSLEKRIRSSELKIRNLLSGSLQATRLTGRGNLE